MSKFSCGSGANSAKRFSLRNFKTFQIIYRIFPIFLLKLKASNVP